VDSITTISLTSCFDRIEEVDVDADDDEEQQQQQ